MDLSIYNVIVAEVNKFNDPRIFIDHLVKIFPRIKRQTFLCIYDQIYQRKMKATYKKHNQLERMNEYYHRYHEKSQQDMSKQIIIKMAKQATWCARWVPNPTLSSPKASYFANLAAEGLSPCLLARIILERYLAFTKYRSTSAPKGEVSELMKKPFKITDAILMKEIQMCTFSDLLYGPITDKRKQSLGHEHEAILKRKLNQVGIPFQDETDLQSKGFDKTPDIMLQVPIAVDGRVIIWVESKASFGDEEIHQGYLRDQYWCYQNRFGPGLVIYWFGFIKELDIHRDDGIMLMDSFPESFEVINTD